MGIELVPKYNSWKNETYLACGVNKGCRVRLIGDGDYTQLSL